MPAICKRRTRTEYARDSTARFGGREGDGGGRGQERFLSRTRNYEESESTSSRLNGKEETDNGLVSRLKNPKGERHGARARVPSLSLRSDLGHVKLKIYEVSRGGGKSRKSHRCRHRQATLSSLISASSGLRLLSVARAESCAPCDRHCG